jgi:hypothetical protein
VVEHRLIIDDPLFDVRASDHSDSLSRYVSSSTSRWSLIGTRFIRSCTAAQRAGEAQCNRSGRAAAAGPHDAWIQGIVRNLTARVDGYRRARRLSVELEAITHSRGRAIGTRAGQRRPFDGRSGGLGPTPIAARGRSAAQTRDRLHR